MAAKVALVGGCLLIAAGYFVPPFNKLPMVMHEFHFVAAVFVLLVGVMLIIGKLRVSRHRLGARRFGRCRSHSLEGRCANRHCACGISGDYVRLVCRLTTANTTQILSLTPRLCGASVFIELGRSVGISKALTQLVFLHLTHRIARQFINKEDPLGLLILSESSI